MPTQFRIMDEYDQEQKCPFDTTRRLYKGLIQRLDRQGKQFRVETKYEDGGSTPVKTLTILKRIM